MFDTFRYTDWITYYSSLNKGLSAEECPLDLTEKEKEAYREAARKLEEDRKAHPDIPINYETNIPESWWDD